MPPVETIGRTTPALVWIPDGNGNYGPKFAETPLELTVRLEEATATTKNPNGQTVAIVATAVVDQPIPDDSLFWLGTIQDLENQPGTSGYPESDLLQVHRTDTIPDVKGRNIRRTVALKKFGDTFPQ